MKNREKNKVRIFANNAYAVKTVWEISRSRVIHTALATIAGFAEWIFMSIFFLRYVINAIENEAPFETIVLFIGICFAVFCLLAVYDSYLNAVVYPYTDNKIYRTLYRRLYAKARNVELRCFEDADFYNRAGWLCTENDKLCQLLLSGDIWRDRSSCGVFVHVYD